MKIYDIIYFSFLILGITLLSQCSGEPTDPSIVALNEVINQHQKAESKVSSTLIPFDQSPIPSTEQLRKSMETSIKTLSSVQNKHLPTSIRIPDPVIRALANQKIIDKTEMQSLLSQLSEGSKQIELSAKNRVDFNQSFRVLDSLGIQSVDAYTQPILINDKLIIGKVTTEDISAYKSQLPKQTTWLKVYQAAPIDESKDGNTWNEIYKKNLR